MTIKNNPPSQQQISRAKTLLNIWNRIDRHVAHHEKLITLIAQHSFDAGSGADELINKIIDRMFNKERLCILKNKIESLAMSLSGGCAQIIRFYFLDKIPTTEICITNGTSSRTVFRQLKTGVEEFASRLGEIGMNTYTFNDLLKDYSWIKGIYEQVCNGEQII